jgi:solute carrier family 34 (sodium-dependent phosphate cotransporter)
MDGPYIVNDNDLVYRRPSILHNVDTDLGMNKKTNLNKRKIVILNAKEETSETTNKHGKEWSSYKKHEKTSYIIFAILKIILFIVLLYFFLLSLNFMTIGFTMVAPYAIKAGPVIKFILANPFAALAIGIVLTAIMQNATATTSIAVSMVGAGIIPDVQSAIPIIMGSNIGTCVTNSLIALTLAGDPNEFKRAFSGATLNDMFNLLTTSILLPVEILSHFLYVVSTELANLMPFDNVDAIASANFMAFILNPVCDLFIKLDPDAVNLLASGSSNITTLIALRCCETKNITGLNNTYFSFNSSTICTKNCSYWCVPMLNAFGDGGTGLFWIIISIIVLIACLFGIVKVISLLIVGPIARAVRISVNATFPKPFGFVSEIILFIVALLLTIVVQSSNIITATLVSLKYI